MCAEPEHRTLVFYNENGELLGPIGPILFSFVLFPEDRVSREQALKIYDIEAQEYRSNPTEHHVSELTKILMGSVERKSGQRIAAGLTMLAFQFLFHKQEQEVSLYRAAQLVEAAIREAKRATDRPLGVIKFDGPEPKVTGVRTPSGRRDIEKAYQTYESVAHILAAELQATDALVTTRLFDRTFEMDAVILNTAALIESTMIARQPNHFSKPWLILPALTEEVRSCGCVKFEGKFIEFLEAGFQNNA